jgi:hypothetical protein
MRNRLLTTVMVYHAGVKKGYSTYCPSCYADCGKRTVTDRTGSFTIQSLDTHLWFELLVIRDGYTATFVRKVGPRTIETTIDRDKDDFAIALHPAGRR